MTNIFIFRSVCALVTLYLLIITISQHKYRVFLPWNLLVFTPALLWVINGWGYKGTGKLSVIFGQTPYSGIVGFFTVLLIFFVFLTSTEIIKGNMKE